jgi:Zn-dependent protease with chaperone function
MSRIARWYFVAFFTFLTVTRTYAAPTGGCREAHAHDNRVGAEIVEPRVVNAAREAVRRSRIGSEVVVCRLELPYLTATVEYLDNSYYVAVSRILIAHFNDAELRAVFGHEMAHIVLGHRATGFELRHLRTAEYEQAADALSASWFGTRGMASVLRKLRTDALKLPEPAERRQATLELNARIQALGEPIRSKPRHMKQQSAH